MHSIWFDIGLVGVGALVATAVTLMAVPDMHTRKVHESTEPHEPLLGPTPLSGYPHVDDNHR